MSRIFLAGIVLSPLILGACGAKISAKRAALTACEAAVEKAADVLPDGLVANVMGIEAGQSGTAVSCAVKAERARKCLRRLRAAFAPWWAAMEALARRSGCR